MTEDVILIDASNLIMGRLASYAAKRALSGNTVVVVNAERAIVSGKKASIVSEGRTRLETRTLASQYKAPVHPRRPDTYLRRVIRGMLPWKLSRGKAAFRRVKVFIGTPQEFADKQFAKLDWADASRLRSRYITLAELSREIGGVEV
jgi:large subunit ribosomal protein L13